MQCIYSELTFKNETEINEKMLNVKQYLENKLKAKG